MWKRLLAEGRGSWRQGWQEDAGRIYYAEHLQQSAQLAPSGTDSTGEVVHAEAGEKETAGCLGDWLLLKHHLEDLNVICKDREEETSGLKTQQQEIGTDK